MSWQPVHFVKDMAMDLSFQKYFPPPENALDIIYKSEQAGIPSNAYFGCGRSVSVYAFGRIVF